MDRRAFLAGGLGAMAAGLGGCAGSNFKPRGQAPRPNAILCMTDDQGWGDVGYNGLKQIKTPNLDEMAASGVTLNRFYAAHPSCSPTRASVMTGRHPNRIGVWPGMPLRRQEVTVAQALNAAGYTRAISASGTSMASPATATGAPSEGAGRRAKPGVLLPASLNVHFPKNFSRHHRKWPHWESRLYFPLGRSGFAPASSPARGGLRVPCARSS